MNRMARFCRTWQMGTAIIALCMVLVGCGNSAATTAGGSGNSTTGSTTSGASTGDCMAQNVTVNGISTELFCGPAKATATYQGQTFTWSKGACFNQQGMIGVNIGHEVLDASSDAGKTLKQQYDYFGANATATAGGTYDGFIAGYFHGQDITGSGTITLASDLKSGTFTGKTIIGSTAVTASWTC